MAAVPTFPGAHRAIGPSEDALVLALEHLVSHALDTEVETAGGLIAHFYVVYVGALEQVPDRGGLILGGGREHAFHQLLAGGIAVQDDCIGLEVRRIAGIRGVASAGLLVDKDGPGQRNSLNSGKRIVGKPVSYTHLDVYKRQHNLRNDVITQIKRSLRGKGPIIRFGPEMSS